MDEGGCIGCGEVPPGTVCLCCVVVVLHGRGVRTLNDPTFPPFDLGFVATVSLQHLLAFTPALSALNFLLAGLNTV
ncbi:hypothetical protein LguiB_025477 [Lonicera macranthoides]